MGRTATGAGALALALLATLGISHPAVLAQEATTVRGVIANGTPGAEIPVGLPVVLDVYELGERIDTIDAVSGPDGSFVFENIPGGFGIGYIISAWYADGFYYYERDYPLPPEPVELRVYESTKDGEAVRITVHTILVNGADADTGLMNVLSLVGLENSGDRTFVPDVPQAGMMSFLRFSLPLLAGEVDVQSSLRGGSILQIDRGFAMTTPVPPGSYEIAYSYQAAYEDGMLSYTQSFPFGAEKFRVLVSSGLGDVSGPGLEQTEAVTLGEQEYLQWEASGLEVGDRIELEFAGLPQPPLWKRWQRSASREGFVAIAIPAFFGLALLSLLGYVLLQRREPALAMPGAPVGLADRRALVEAIALLDDRFVRREIEEEEYLQQRRTLKDRALYGPGGRDESGSDAAPEETDPQPAPQSEEGREVSP